MESKRKERQSQNKETIFYDELGPYLKHYFTKPEVRAALIAERERFFQEMEKETDDNV